ncbi:MAG: TSUP family transporter [Gemmatimonadales bacterium]
MGFGILLATVAVVAGGIAAVTGFGIGSLLTPALALKTGTKLAVAAIAIPHFIATAQRFWLLRRHVDREVLLGFGVASAVGGLGGALLHTQVSSAALAVVFGGLLILAGVSELTGWMQRVRWGSGSAWAAGALRVPKEAFVATATAIGLFVDGARLPVYLATGDLERVAAHPGRQRGCRRGDRGGHADPGAAAAAALPADSRNPPDHPGRLHGDQRRTVAHLAPAYRLLQRAPG